MGLFTALHVSTTGLHTMQTGINMVAANIAQADVAGYKRQEMVPEELSVLGGVRGTVARAADAYLENQYRIETARSAETEVKDFYLSRIDQLFGVPGGSGSLDTMFNEFGQSLENFASSPDDYASRALAVSSALSLTSSLNELSGQIQTLRQTAEDGIATVVDDINDALSRLEELNSLLVGGNANEQGHNERLNERDRQLARLADAMEIRVVERDNGTIAVFGKSGDTLLDGTAVQLSFDHRGDVNAYTQYSPDAGERRVGTVMLQSSNGYELDLINNGILDTGRLGALIDMRDNVLVEAQNQLDALASGLAKAFSDVEVGGVAATSGAAAGFDLSLDGLQSGNSISLSFSEGGQARNVTLVRVDDPALLPLSDDFTGAAGDTMIGIDFSAGYAAAALAINAQLSPSVNVSALGDGLRFLDDGATGNSDITAVTSSQTITGLQDGTEALPLFMDGQYAQTNFTGSMDGNDQRIGFAARIGVNGQVVDDSELLVKFASTTEIGDTTRPLALIDRLNNSEFTVSPSTGIGSARSPYKGSVMEFARLVVSDQTGNAASAQQAKASQDVVLASLEDSLNAKTGVDIDTELAKLISLQNSFAANARVIQAANEMMQQLLQI